MGPCLCLKNLQFVPSIYYFFFVGIKKILFKLSKSDFLINISCYELSFCKFMFIMSCVWYLIFRLLILLQQRNFFLPFHVSMFHFYCHYYFHYIYLWEYKKPPLGSGQPSTNNQINTTHIQFNNGSFSEHFSGNTAGGNHWRNKTQIHSFTNLQMGFFWNSLGRLFGIF